MPTVVITKRLMGMVVMKNSSFVVDNFENFVLFYDTGLSKDIQCHV